MYYTAAAAVYFKITSTWDSYIVYLDENMHTSGKQAISVRITSVWPT